MLSPTPEFWGRIFALWSVLSRPFLLTVNACGNEKKSRNVYFLGSYSSWFLILALLLSLWIILGKKRWVWDMAHIKEWLIEPWFCIKVGKGVVMGEKIRLSRVKFCSCSTWYQLGHLQSRCQGTAVDCSVCLFIKGNASAAALNLLDKKSQSEGFCPLSSSWRKMPEKNASGFHLICAMQEH